MINQRSRTICHILSFGNLCCDKLTLGHWGLRRLIVTSVACRAFQVGSLLVIIYHILSSCVRREFSIRPLWAMIYIPVARFTAIRFYVSFLSAVRTNFTTILSIGGFVPCFLHCALPWTAGSACFLPTNICSSRSLLTCRVFRLRIVVVL